MSDIVETVTHESLASIQAAIADLRTAMRTGFDEIRAQNPRERRDPAGTLVMMPATAGDFDLRVRSLQERIAALDLRS